MASTRWAITNSKGVVVAQGGIDDRPATERRSIAAALRKIARCGLELDAPVKIEVRKTRTGETVDENQLPKESSFSVVRIANEAGKVEKTVYLLSFLGVDPELAVLFSSENTKIMASRDIGEEKAAMVEKTALLEINRKAGIKDAYHMLVLAGKMVFKTNTKLSLTFEIYAALLLEHAQMLTASWLHLSKNNERHLKQSQENIGQNVFDRL